MPTQHMTKHSAIEPRALSVMDFARTYGISRSQAYREAEAGRHLR